MVRSLAQLQRVDLGIDARNVLVADLLINSGKYDTRAKSSQFFETLFERLRQAPGVRVVGATSSLPLDGTSTAGLHIEGEPVPDGPLPSIGYVMINDDYFKALGIRLLKGRAFGSQEPPDVVPRGVVLNEEAVRRFFPTRDPLGARLQLGPDPNGPWYVVVGVVANNRQHGFDAGYVPVAYTSYRQEGQRYLSLVLKTAGDPMTVVPFLRAAVREMDRAQPLNQITTFDEVAGNALNRRRFSMVLLSIFAGVSLVLAVVGVYGVLAYAVSTRTQELGVRIALGANTRTVLALVLRQGFLAAAAGVLLGVLGALGATRTLRGLLYGVAPTDLGTYAVVALTIIAASVAASYVPARRATRVDPVEALRSD
jgi:putative ABC transport system permease protein